MAAHGSASDPGPTLSDALQQLLSPALEVAGSEGQGLPPAGSALEMGLGWGMWTVAYSGVVR